jgi:lipopolysaccharide export LptBFGC system permease protein LptF
MSLTSRNLTEPEKAVLYYHVFGGVQDWKLLYNIADGNPIKGEPVKFLDTYVSRWKNSDKVKEYIKTLIAQKADQDAEQRNKGRQEERNKIKEEETRPEENESTKPEPPKPIKKEIDYSDPKNRQKLYNEVIARSGDDPKTQLDAAKMFEQIQKDDREAAKAQKQSRVYLPLRCFSCPLYARQAKKTIK